ncbi:hypothetical protein FHG87_021343 [Trinorchestia longiramus]|nr:hypothetical protein FHG87_021343 [Trinorchestia longiramus]
MVLLYRNPTCVAIDDDELYGHLDNISSAPHETLIMKNYNFPYSICTNQIRTPGSTLISLINTNSLNLHFNEPTRQDNILDLVLTTHDLRIIELKVMDQTENNLN